MTSPFEATGNPPLSGVKLPGMRRLAVWGVALVFTLLALQWSERNGRLSQDPTYDDAGYMIDGAARQQVLDAKGLPGLASNLVRNPPHSAFSTLLALVSFETLGTNDWAPYAFNFFVLAAYLFFCCRFFGDLRAAAFYCLLIFCLTIPFALRSIHDFRPDFASALATAGFAWFGLATAVSDERRERANVFRAGFLFGVALWIKPTVFAHTLAIALLVGAIIAVGGWLPGARRGFRRGLFLAAIFGVIGVVVAAPYFLINGRQTIEYFVQNTRADERVDNFQGTIGAFLRDFVVDGATALFIGRYLWLLIALCGIGLAWAIRGRRYLVIWQVAGLLVAALASLSIFVVGRHISEYFGLYFQIPLLFAALVAVSALIRTYRPAFIIAPALLVVGLLPTFSTGETNFWVSAPEANPVYGWNRKLVDAMVADAGLQRSHGVQTESPIAVFVAFGGFVSGPSMQWICAKERLPFSFDDLILSGDSAAQLRWARKSSYVVASTPDASSVYSYLPSGKSFAPVLAAIRADPSFHEIKVDSEAAPPYRLFRNDASNRQIGGRNQVVIGWPATGFLTVEGPYPQLHLPKVRWSTFPRSSVTVTVPQAGSASLRFSASAVPGSIVRIKVNGEPEGEHVQVSPGAETTEVSLPLRAGENVVTLDYSVPNGDPAPGTRAFLFTNFELTTSVEPAKVP